MHISGIQKLPDARLVAVCDIEPLMAEQVAARYNISGVYKDLVSLIDAERPDVVHIVTPPHSHPSLVRAALDAGCHVVVEKPLALDAWEAAQIVAHAEARARKLTIGYTYYFDPAIRLLRDLIREGVMGEAVHLESFFGYDLKGPFGTAVLADPNHWVHALPGKLLHNLLDHLVNKIAEFIPDETTLIEAHAWQRGKPLPGNDFDLPDELRVVVIGERTSAYVTVSSHSRPIRHFLEFHGTKNSALIDFDNSTLTLHKASALPGVLGRLASPFTEGWQHIRQGSGNVFRFARSDYHFFAAFNYLLNEFYNCIMHDRPVPIPYREILRTATLVEEIVHQVQGDKVKVE